MNEETKTILGCIGIIAVIVAVAIFGGSFLIGMGTSILEFFGATAVPGVLSFLVGLIVFVLIFKLLLIPVVLFLIVVFGFVLEFIVK